MSSDLDDLLNRTMIGRNNYVKETQDTMFKRNTRKTIPNEGN